MARDVEFGVVADDKTGPGLDSAARRFKATDDKIKREQERSNKRFGDRLVKTVGAISPKLGEALADGVAAGAKLGAPLLTTGLAVGLPALASLMSGAIVGGVGIGGVVGGVALAARDARVQSAGKALGERLLGGLERSAQPFIRPVLDAIDDIGARFDRVRGNIDSIFANASRFVGPLSGGIGDLFESVVRAVDKVTSRAMPVIRAISEGLSGTGRSLEVFFDAISSDGDSSARAVKAAFDTLNATLQTTGVTLGALSKILGYWDQVIPLAPLGKFVTALNEADSAGRRTTGGTFELNTAMQLAAGETRTYAQVMDEAARQTDAVASAQASLYGTTTNLAQAMADANKTIAENGRTLSLNSQKGRENRRALDSVAQGMRAVYADTVAVNGVGIKSAQVASNNANQFVRLAQKAGLGAGAARRLASDLGLIPTKRETKIIADTKEAEARAKRVRDLLSQVRSKTVSVNVIVNESRLNAVNRRLERAGGGNARGDGGFARTADTGGFRTEPARPVQISNRVLVDIDGRPFRSFTYSAIADNNRHNRWLAQKRR